MSLKISRNDVYIRDEKGPEWFEDFLRSLAQQSTTQNILDAINKKRGETVEGVVSKYRAMVGLDALADDSENDINKEASHSISFDEFWKNSPKTVQLKNDIMDFSQSLNTWNLKYDAFPDVKKWIDEHMKGFPYGHEEVYKYLSDVMKNRADNYWNVSYEFRAQPDHKQLMGILADLAGDEGKEKKVSEKTSQLKPISVRHAKELDKDKKDVVVIIEGDPKLKADFESILKGSGGTKNTHAILHFLRGLLGSDLVSYSDDHLIQYIDEMKKKYVNTNFEEPSGNAGRVGTEPIEEFNDHAADFMGHGKGK